MSDYIFEQYALYVEGIEDKKKAFYIKERLIDQIKWYDKKAIEKQKRYKLFVIASIVCTALIPVISLLTGFKYGIFASGIIAGLSSGATALTTIVNLCEYQKLWIEYRNNCELLKSMLHKYFNKIGEFSAEDEEARFLRLVELTESYLVREFQSWKDLSHGENCISIEKNS